MLKFFFLFFIFLYSNFAFISSSTRYDDDSDQDGDEKSYSSSDLYDEDEEEPKKDPKGLQTHAPKESERHLKQGDQGTLGSNGRTKQSSSVWHRCDTFDPDDIHHDLDSTIDLNSTGPVYHTPSVRGNAKNGLQHSQKKRKRRSSDSGMYSVSSEQSDRKTRTSMLVRNPTENRYAISPLTSPAFVADEQPTQRVSTFLVDDEADVFGNVSGRDDSEHAPSPQDIGEQMDPTTMQAMMQTMMQTMGSMVESVKSMTTAFSDSVRSIPFGSTREMPHHRYDDDDEEAYPQSRGSSELHEHSESRMSGLKTRASSMAQSVRRLRGTSNGDIDLGHFDATNGSVGRAMMLGNWEWSLRTGIWWYKSSKFAKTIAYAGLITGGTCQGLLNIDALKSEATAPLIVWISVGGFATYAAFQKVAIESHKAGVHRCNLVNDFLTDYADIIDPTQLKRYSNYLVSFRAILAAERRALGIEDEDEVVEIQSDESDEDEMDERQSYEGEEDERDERQSDESDRLIDE